MVEEISDIINKIIINALGEDEWFPLFKKISCWQEQKAPEGLQVLIYMLQYKENIPPFYIDIFTSLL